MLSNSKRIVSKGWSSVESAEASGGRNGGQPGAERWRAPETAQTPVPSSGRSRRLRTNRARPPPHLEGGGRGEGSGRGTNPLPPTSVRFAAEALQGGVCLFAPRSRLASSGRLSMFRALRRPSVSRLGTAQGGTGL